MTPNAKISILLRWTRVLLFTGTAALAVVTMAVTIQLFVRGKMEKKFVRDNLPPGVTVDIKNGDVLGATIAALISAWILFFVAVYVVVDTVRRAPRGSTLTRQAWVTGCAIVLAAATLTPLTVITRTRAAGVTAFLDGMALPDSFVVQQEAALGVSRVYWDTSYVRCVAAAPWFSLVVGVPALLSTVVARVLFKAPPEVLGGSKEDEEGKY